MKGKTKMEKGITLIALIITIVVLLILAAVAIASITNDGVLSYAENATTQYNQAVKNEQDTLQGYIDYLNKHNGGSDDSNEDGKNEDNPVMGSYVNYGVAYEDMYAPVYFGGEENGNYGWRYLHNEYDHEYGDSGVAIVSTGIPVKFNYSYIPEQPEWCNNEDYAWGTHTYEANFGFNYCVAYGLTKNFELVPFEKVNDKNADVECLEMSYVNVNGCEGGESIRSAFVPEGLEDYVTEVRCLDRGEYYGLGGYFSYNIEEDENNDMVYLHNLDVYRGSSPSYFLASTYYSDNDNLRYFDPNEPSFKWGGFETVKGLRVVVELKGVSFEKGDNGVWNIVPNK